MFQSLHIAFVLRHAGNQKPEYTEMYDKSGEIITSNLGCFAAKVYLNFIFTLISDSGSLVQKKRPTCLLLKAAPA